MRHIINYIPKFVYFFSDKVFLIRSVPINCGSLIVVSYLQFLSNYKSIYSDKVWSIGMHTVLVGFEYFIRMIHSNFVCILYSSIKSGLFTKQIVRQKSRKVKFN